MRTRLLVLFAALLFSGGCTTPEAMLQLQQERDALATSLQTAQGQITGLEADKDQLEQRVQHLEQVERTLHKEKDVRIAETADVRHTVRDFVREQVRSINDFAQASHLLDYIGGELIERSALEGEDLLLVDLAHPMTSPGTLANGRLLTRGPCRVVFCVLRPLGDRMIVLWRSETQEVPGPGLHRMPFFGSVAVEAGDLIGLYTDGPLQVPYDPGTGETGLRSGRVKPDQSIPETDLRRQGARAYSFGVEGFLE